VTDPSLFTSGSNFFSTYLSLSRPQMQRRDKMNYWQQRGITSYLIRTNFYITLICTIGAIPFNLTTMRSLFDYRFILLFYILSLSLFLPRLIEDCSPTFSTKFRKCAAIVSGCLIWLVCLALTLSYFDLDLMTRPDTLQDADTFLVVSSSAIGCMGGLCAIGE
jgi:hypothetical protein